MKALCFAGMIFGVLAVIIFGLDLALQIPFGRPSGTLDIGFIVMGLVLIYTGWSTKQELR